MGKSTTRPLRINLTFQNASFHFVKCKEEYCCRRLKKLRKAAKSCAILDSSKTFAVKFMGIQKSCCVFLTILNVISEGK